jgi:hypothetical protein
MHLQLSAVFVGVHAAQRLCLHLHLDSHVVPSEHFEHRGGMIDQDMSKQFHFTVAMWCTAMGAAPAESTFDAHHEIAGICYSVHVTCLF